MMASENDNRFRSRIQAAIATVQAWDADPSLIAECRAMIPFDVLVPPTETDFSRVYGIPVSPYQRDDDYLYQGNALFLQRLVYFFQKDVMTWVNEPTCNACGGKDMEHVTIRGPETEEEREGGAARVEVYRCKSCGSETTFPRYNSVRKLLETRKGRCGEYANLFGLYCRAAGFETRYILDVTDHVWIEVLIGDHWVMADSCEGIMNKPSMYESGWGKDLSYIVAVSMDEVVDVTPRYTRKFSSADFQVRRREICSSEEVGAQIMAQTSRVLRQGLSKARFEELRKMERASLDEHKNVTEWTEEEKHGKGRISGSLQWKLLRQEAGKEESSNGTVSEVKGFHVEQFYPKSDKVTISVRPLTHGIHVGGAMCDPGQPYSFSVVVIDDKHLGCILQCRSFLSLEDVATFVDTIPAKRIVALKGVPKETVNITEATRQLLKRLGGFVLPENLSDGILYIGQVEAAPKWTVCFSHNETAGAMVELQGDSTAADLRLRTERNTVPATVTARLPDSIMSLQAQMDATNEEKRQAFLKFVAQTKNETKYVGYTTKRNSPVYLLSKKSFPFEHKEAADPNDAWATFHYLPEVLVPSDDNGIQEPQSAIFDIPVDSSFYTDLFGTQLLSPPQRENVDTMKALQSSRLVGLYFSAHWCPPCRQFTPMLIELYSHLKDEKPTHGLEVVFVSSDRDVHAFNDYYGSMPWLAVPFQTRERELKIRYGVRGIPSLVILDAVSGQVVVSASESRGEVLNACRMGDQGIEQMFESWLQRVPPETHELINLLAFSCKYDDEGKTEEKPVENDYMVRNPNHEIAKDPQTLIKEEFAKLVAGGTEPNTAAAQAMKVVMQRKEEADVGNVVEYSASVYIGTSTEKESSGGEMKIFNINQGTKDLVDIQVSRGTEGISGVKCCFGDGREDSISFVAADGEDNPAEWKSALTDGTSLSACQAVLGWSSDIVASLVLEPIRTKNERNGNLVLRLPSGYKITGPYGVHGGGRLLSFGLAASSNSSEVSSSSSSSSNSSIPTEVVSTLLKYLKNARDNPSNPKFRVFKLSNKVFDRITKAEGALDLLMSRGFKIEAYSHDFVATIPLGLDLDRLFAELSSDANKC